jgi:uncharacterized membrane protein YeaQ/YmgE (transglycosylase-associated protein family)
MEGQAIGWVVLIVIGGVAGWLAERVMGSSHGIIINVVLGIVGAVVARFLLGIIGIGFGGLSGQLIAGFLGACVLIWLGRLVKK